MRVLIYPEFDSPDTKGDGGIRRVVEAQREFLPQFDIEVVESEAQADVVAIHGGATMRTKKPVVAHCHGLYWSDYSWQRWAKELNKDVVETMRTAAAVTAPSKWVAYALARGMMIKAPVVYHGVDVAAWALSEKRTPYVLWNKTRPDPVCDPAIIDELVHMLPDVLFVSTFGQASPNLKVTGRLPYEEAKEHISGASVYLATTRETMGIGTLEAMACGAVPVGFAWGGQAEFLTHKKDGWLGKPNHLEELAAGIRWALENPEVGLLARKNVEANFQWPDKIEQYANLYKKVWAESRTSVRTSVVITCYNLAGTLPRAVDSVLSQKDPDLEVIIVDDNSPDATAEIAGGYTALDSRVRVVTNEKNLYLSGALNAGINTARGRYIIPLDADNELASGALPLLADQLDADPGLDIAYGAMELVKPDGSRSVGSWPGDFDYDSQLRHRNQLPSTSAYRKSIWSKVGGYRQRCRTAEDADFWCRATSFGARAKKVTDAVTLVYYDRQESMSHVESDWPWHEWYPWHRYVDRVPFAAPTKQDTELVIPSYEPPLVTVIIPVGPGHGGLLWDALDSLVAQTYVGWRVIVVNDSGENLEVPPYVELLKTRVPGSGPSVARNVAIKACKTPLFLPLDADDYLQPEALEVLVDVWRKNSDKKLYYYTDWIVQETGQEYASPEFTCEALRLKLIHGVTALYPKVPGVRFDEKLEAWEDWDFVLQYIKAGYCGVRVPIPAFYYRMQSGGRRETMHEQWPKLKENIASKWHEWMREGKDMGCGCSGSPRINYNANGAAASGGPHSPTGEAGNDMMLLEFTGNGGARSFRGMTSGANYRFGGDESHKRGYVFKADYAATFENRREFKVVETTSNGATNEITLSGAKLEAKGPPRRELVHA